MVVKCAEKTVEPVGLIIFGASGDLTSRKLIPSIFSLYKKENMNRNFFLMGCARTPLSDEKFREKVRSSIEKTNTKNVKELKSFSERCYYTDGNYDDNNFYNTLKQKIQDLMKKFSIKDIILYLATPPVVYPVVVEKLGENRFCKDGQGSYRIVVEKPYGYDLDSAKQLDKKFRKYFQEEQIYRIDHYLGKETVQNILMFRFANGIFEPLWNRQYIDHVQVTISESLGLGHRAGYFNRSGIIRDMFQNHMMQMLSLAAMEPPISFEADHVRDEKVKLLNSIRPYPIHEIGKWMVRSQYSKGTIDEQTVPGYLEEEDIPKTSETETFLATKLFIDNWRWQGVPFYMRTGKRLPKKVSEIIIVFKRIPYSMFKPGTGDDINPNILVIKVQPDEGIILTVQAKSPGAKFCMDEISLKFDYKEHFGIDFPDAYERLLLDVMLGDQTLFWRSDGVFASWSLITPVLQAWEKNEKQNCPCSLSFYKAGEWGSKESIDLIQRDKREWLVL